MRLREILAAGRRLGASDVHLAAGQPARYRVDGRLRPLDDEPIADDELLGMVRLLAGGRALRALARSRAVDVAADDPAAGRLRLHAGRAQGGTFAAIRLLGTDVPDAERLELPQALLRRLAGARGLVLFAGPTGSGKTTAMAACVDYVNRRVDGHIVTIEDPVEYVVPSRRSRVTQRQVGRDVAGFEAGVRHALRADPDVVAIGELRDRASMGAALRAAETGHLVLATVHSGGAVGAVERVIDAFGADAAAIRAQLASTLEAVLAVELLPRREGGRVLNTELMLGTDAVRALVREGKTHQLRNALATGRAAGMHTMEARRAELVARGEVAP